MRADRQDEHHEAGQAAKSGTRSGSRSGSGAAAGAKVNIYLLSWIALAAFGVGYIGVAATRPDLLAGLIPLSDTGVEQLAGGRSAGDIADELAAMRKWINDLQHEMVATKSAVQNNERHQEALQQRMTAAEERLPPVREVGLEGAHRSAAVAARQQPAKQVTAAKHVDTRIAEAKAPTAVGQSQDATATESEPTNSTIAPAVSGALGGVKIINSSPASDVVTSSLSPAPAPATTPAIAPSAAQSAAVTKPFSPPKVVAATETARGIEIAAAESLDGLRSQWSALSSRNAAALQRLEPRYRISTANNSQTPFTLLAGPFANTTDAARACAQLRAGGVTCRVSDFGGNGL